MKNTQTLNIVATVTVVVVWSGLYWFSHPRPPRPDRLPHVAVGEVLAGEARARLEPEGRIIAIVRDFQPFQVPASEAQFEGFERGLAKVKQSIAVLRKLQVDPLRPVSVPPGEFFELLKGARENDVIVSFLGPPLLEPGQLARLGNKRPTVLAVCSSALPAQVNLKSVFDQKLLSAAIIFREGAPSHSTARSQQAAFDQMFRLITSDNLTELPETAVARN